MRKLTSRTVNWGASRSLVSVPVLPAVAAKEVASFVNRTYVAQIAEVQPATEKKFQDPTDQMAWDAYKRIEPRYSDSNRRLAK